MLGMTPDPMSTAAPPVTKWDAARRGVSAFLADCETVQQSGLTYVIAGVKTFRHLGGGNDFEIETSLQLDPRQKLRTVRSPATRLGRDAARRANPSRPHSIVTDDERLDGAAHRCFTKSASHCQPLTKPHDPRERVDDLEFAVRAGARNKQTAVVRTQVEGGNRHLCRQGRLARLVSGEAVSPNSRFAHREPFRRSIALH